MPPRRRCRKYSLALESLEERQVLSASTVAGHALANGLNPAALKIKPPPLPKTPPPLPPPPKPPPLNPADAVHGLVGEAGRSIHTASATTMSLRNANRTSHRLNPSTQRVLKPYFGDLPGRVTVYYGADPLNSWSGKGYTLKLGGPDTAAQTFGLNIYIRSARENMTDRERLKFIIHELTHSQ